MDTEDQQWLTVHEACRRGDIGIVRRYFRETGSPRASPQTHSSASDPTTSSDATNPNRDVIVILLTAACEGMQRKVFAYIWDKILSPPKGTPIPWPCLKASAYKGQVDLANTLWERDPDCFSRTEPRAAIGPERDGHQQFNIAIRNDNYDYIDFMIAHGGDLNAGLKGGNDILKMVVNCAVEDEITAERARFLVDRGVEIKKSMALRESVRGGAVELVRLLIDCGANVDAKLTPESPTCLAIAEEEGYQDIVKVLRNAKA